MQPTMLHDPVVLVVEDNEVVADLYSEWLAEICPVRTAYDAGEALEAMDDDVDIVLLDRRLPGRSGDEVLAEFHERDYEFNVAMVTAIDPDFDIVDMGFDEYVTKPVTAADLYEVVGRLTERPTYSPAVREYFTLSSKKAALEDEKRPEELAESEEYAKLREELDAVRDRIERLEDA